MDGMGERTLLAEQVYQRIRADLLRGHIRPGERLTEEWAADHYAASRTPVREACRRLAEEGLLTHRPRRGYRVPPINEQEIEELYEIRRALELLSVRRAAAVAHTPGGAAAITQLREQWRTLVPAAGAKVVYNDEAFHRELAGVGGNAQLSPMLDAISARIRLVRVHDFLDQERVVATRVQHLGILDAVLAGDADLAAALMHAHISESQRAVVASAGSAAGGLSRARPRRTATRGRPTS
jgi:DNA-binding GntR family transcriptional regulator